MVTVTEVDYALTPDQHARELRRAVVAATVGTTIEWYDFLLYSTMAGLVFGKLFFPNEDPLTATLNSFAIYFVGFVARPIGAFIFGHYGDRVGRKSTLIVTLVLMGISTFLVAFLPGYASIGIWGAVLLTILRLLQGIGVGGEWGARCCSRWNGRATTMNAASCRPGRNSAALRDCSWPTSPFSSSAGCRAMPSYHGAGASRSRSASCSSASACGSGSASSKRRCSEI